MLTESGKQSATGNTQKRLPVDDLRNPEAF